MYSNYHSWCSQVFFFSLLATFSDKVTTLTNGKGLLPEEAHDEEEKSGKGSEE